MPACSIIPTTTKRAEVEASAGAQDANHEVSCLPYTSAVPVLPPIIVLIGEPSKAIAPDTSCPPWKRRESAM